VVHGPTNGGPKHVNRSQGTWPERQVCTLVPPGKQMTIQVLSKIYEKLKEVGENFEIPVMVDYHT
jgi:hypothetical protein